MALKHLCLRFAIAAFLLSAASCQKGSDRSLEPHQSAVGNTDSPENKDAVPSQDIIYYVLTTQVTAIDPTRPTHLITAGTGDGVGTLFQEAAISHMLRLKEAYPNDQIVAFFPFEQSQSAENTLFTNAGLKIVRTGSAVFNMPELEHLVEPFNEIKTWAHFSHAWDNYASLQYDYIAVGDDLSFMRDRLTKDAYVIFFGCNSGWNLASFVAKSLGVPVAGALTSAAFEKFHSTENFYYGDLTMAPAGPWAKSNDKSFSTTRPCWQGGCVRLKPDNFPYDGIHGQYTEGLNFYKFFCGGVSSDECALAMAKSLVTFPDLKPLSFASAGNDFRSAAKDFMCPIHPKHPIRQECISKLTQVENGDATIDFYNPFEGPTTNCSFDSCNSRGTSSGQNKTFTNEYKMYLRGIALLTNHTF